MRDVFERVAKTVREIVCRVYTPLRAGTMMRCFKHAIGCKIPHTWISRIKDILLHAQKGLLRFVFSVAHRSKLADGFLNGAISMNALKSRILLAFFAAPSPMNLFGCGIKTDEVRVYLSNDRRILCPVE